MSAWAKPGIECVCVQSPVPISTRPARPGIPVVGGVYKIFDVADHPVFGVMLGLIGVPYAWSAVGCFRPLPKVQKTLEQDVATFLPLLTPDLETASASASIWAMATDAQTAFSGEGA